MTTSEHQQILFEWNDTRCEDREGRCIHQLFEMQAGDSTDVVAINFGQEELTYGEVNRRANQLAHFLRNKGGVGPEVVVGICVERSTEMIIGILGILKAGGAYLPLDPSHPHERNTFILGDAGVSLLLTQEALQPSLIDASNPGHGLLAICLDTEASLIAVEREENPQCCVTPENLAYVIYTSGSMGRPKGVLLEHGGVSNLIEAQIEAFALDKRDRVLQFASICFDASVSEIFTTLAAGATLDLGTREGVYSGPFLNQFLNARAITTVTLPPVVLESTLEEGNSSLKAVVSAGEKCPIETMKRWSPGRRFINAYGPTETAVCASLIVCNEFSSVPISIGRPISNKEIYLLDQGLRPVPIDVAGELFVAGSGLARGYVGKPDLTAERFLPNALTTRTGSRLYRSGDLAFYLPDGKIVFVGRVDYQVKIRGFRIELGEIEQVLSQHPDVQGALVLAQGEGVDKYLVAYVVRKAGAGLNVSRLQRYLTKLIPEYMVPSAFAILDEFPLTSSGKVDRQKLPLPEQIRPDLDDQYVPPRFELESELCRIFKEVLDIDRVGINDNFFALGGHSLLALQVMARVQDIFLVELPVGYLFESPTVAELAVVIAESQTEQLDALGSTGVSSPLIS
jgi:amino acid adenylation domain-containing protein